MTTAAAFVRCRRDAVLVLFGAVVLVVGALPVDKGNVSGVEKAVFEAVNGVPDVLPFVVVWLVMQLGNIAVVPVAALLALVLRRYRLSLGLALAGVITYVGAKVVKQVVARGRPLAELDDVTLRGDVAHGLGFVSGHAAVVAALSTVAWPHLHRTGRRLAVAAAVFVGVARIYVGAHLPLDVLAGAGLGIAIGGLVNLLVGRPGPCP